MRADEGMPTSHAKRIVNDQRDLVLVCNLRRTLPHPHIQSYIWVAYLGNLSDRADVVLRVSNALHIYRLGLLIDSSRKCCRIV